MNIKKKLMSLYSASQPLKGILLGLSQLIQGHHQMVQALSESNFKVKWKDEHTVKELSTSSGYKVWAMVDTTKKTMTTVLQLILPIFSYCESFYSFRTTA